MERRTPLSWAILAALLLAGTPGLAKVSGAQPSAEECAVAVAAFTHVLSSHTDPRRRLQLGESVSMGSIIVRQAEGEPGPPDREARRWVAFPLTDPPTFVAPPSPALVKRFGDRAPASATACPAIRAMAARKRVRIGVTRDRLRRNRLYRSTAIDLSAGVLSDDGLEALVYSDAVSGPLAGGGQLLLLRRTRGGPWRVVSAAGLWVS